MLHYRIAGLTGTGNYVYMHPCCTHIIIHTLSYHVQVTSIMSVQSRHMAHSYANFHFNTSFGTCSISNSTFWIVNSMSILIVLPTLNLLVYPCLREYTPSLLKRIGLSYVLSAVSSLVLLLIVHVGHKDPRLRILHQLSEYCLFADRGIERDDRLLLSSWTLLLPLLLASISEIFVNVSSESDRYRD